VTIESAFTTALSGLVADKVYPDMNDARTAAPYIVYQRVGGAALTFLERASPSVETVRVQVTAWATTRTAAVTLAGQAQDALVALTSMSVKPAGAAVSLVDPATKLRGAAQDFIVWADR
jgi:hypothetical protein